MSLKTLLTRRFFSQRQENFLLFATAAALTLFVLVLLWLHYITGRQLEQASYEELRLGLEKRAAALGYFFSERRNDMRSIKKNRAVAAYFENKALGMSLDYGLRASLLDIEAYFQRLSQYKTLESDLIYLGMSLLSPDGEVLAGHGASQAMANPVMQPIPLAEIEDGTAKGEGAPVLITVHTTAQGVPRLLLQSEYRFKGQRRGYLLAWLNAASLYRHLLDTPQKLWEPNNRQKLYIDVGRFQLINPQEHKQSWSQCMEQAWYAHGQQDRFFFVMPQNCPQEGAGKSMLGLRVPVPNTGFHLVAAVPEKKQWGMSRPWMLSLTMLLTGGGIMGASMLVFVSKTQNIKLRSRLQQDQAVRQTIERHRLELEKRVEQRTQELQALQQEQVNQALESGRAQLAAMVLHNIGNAVTPLKIQLESAQEYSDSDIVTYIQKTHQALTANTTPAGTPLDADKRHSLNAYMERLLEALKQNLDKRNRDLDQMRNSIDYIAETLVLQQHYAASEQEVPVEVSLNTLLEDALLMQQHSLSKRHIQLDKEYAGDLPSLVIEKNRLMQTLVNVIKNSYEAIEEQQRHVTDQSYQGRMRLVTRYLPSKQRLSLIIADNGRGMSPQQQEHLFEYGTSAKGSTGFGLYYCHMFITSRGGSLHLESRGIGEGTTVFIELPVKMNTADNNTKEDTSEGTSLGGG